MSSRSLLALIGAAYLSVGCTSPKYVSKNPEVGKYKIPTLAPGEIAATVREGETSSWRNLKGDIYQFTPGQPVRILKANKEKEKGRNEASNIYLDKLVPAMLIKDAYPEIFRQIKDRKNRLYWC